MRIAILDDYFDTLRTLPCFRKLEEYETQYTDIFDQILADAAGAPINVVNPAALEWPAQPAGKFAK